MYLHLDWKHSVKTEQEHETDRWSTTGYCVILNQNGPLISWKSKRRSTVALSTCEAEYMALATTVQECMQFIQL